MSRSRYMTEVLWRVLNDDLEPKPGDRPELRLTLLELKGAEPADEAIAAWRPQCDVLMQRFTLERWQGSKKWREAWWPEVVSR